MSKNYSSLDSITDLVNWLHEYPPQAKFKRVGIRLREITPFHRIMYCSQALLFGALPDAKTLEFVANAFDKYVSSEGGMTLDEAFGLVSISKAGNPSKQYTSKNNLNVIMFEIARYRVDNPETTIANAAEQVSKQLNIIKPDSDSLVRYYSEGKWGDVEKILPSLIRK